MLVKRFSAEALPCRIVSTHLDHFGYAACAIPVSIDLHNEMNGIGHLGTNEFVIQIGIGRQCEVREPVEGKHRAVCMHRRHRAAVSRIHRLEHVVRGVVADFADDDAVGSVPERRSNQMGDRNRWSAWQFVYCFPAHDIPV